MMTKLTTTVLATLVAAFCATTTVAQEAVNYSHDGTDLQGFMVKPLTTLIFRSICPTAVTKQLSMWMPTITIFR